MRVPVGANCFLGCVFGTAVDLNEPYPPFYQSSCQEALLSEGPYVGILKEIQFLRSLGFRFQFYRLGRAHLKFPCQLKRGNARFQKGVA